jgi:hypothetical protein
VFAGVAERLARFVEPFGRLLNQPAQRSHAADYVSGLLSDLERARTWSRLRTATIKSATRCSTSSVAPRGTTRR